MSLDERSSWSVTPATRRKLALARFCARVDRSCARMNSGLAAVAVVLAAASFSLSVLRLAEEVTSDDQLGKLPFIEMSTDGPDTGLWWLIGE
jgi:hypothetical protein